VREFSDKSEYSHIAFGDVNLAEARGTAPWAQAGMGGWPTIRYFNAETGYQGAAYQQKTSKSMCDELGDKQYLRDYITDKSIKPCVVNTEDNCSDEEKKFIDDWRSRSKIDVEKEYIRLEKVISQSTKTPPKQIKWIKQRANILKQFNLQHTKQDL